MNITEIENPYHLNVEKMKMSCNDNAHNVPEPLQRGSFFYIIVGQPQSGKTNLWLNLIKRRRCFYYKQFHKIYIFSNSIHTINEKISLPPAQIIKGFSEDKLQQVIDDEEEEERNRDDDEEPSRVLMIFDDVVSGIKKNLPSMLKLTFNRRHIGGGVSIMLISQKFNKIPLELRTVATGLFFFSTKNRQEIESVWKEYGDVSKETFFEVLRYIFDTRHNFLYISLTKPQGETMHKNFNQLTISDGT